MSADNEIAVYRHSDGRWRVKHEVSFDAGRLTTEEMDALFANARAFDKREDAYEHALELQHDCEVCEYGVCFYERQVP